MKAYQDAGKEAQEIVAEAVRTAEDEKQESLAKASAEIEREVIIDGGSRQAVIEEIIRHVCGLEGLQGDVLSNLDYLAARLHGSRSKMAEGERLDALCRIRSVEEYARTILPDGESRSIGDLQRQLIERFIEEIRRVAAQLTGARAHLVAWMPVRFESENLKVLLRSSITKVNPEDAAGHLVHVPGLKSAEVHCPRDRRISHRFPARA